MLPCRHIWSPSNICVGVFYLVFTHTDSMDVKYFDELLTFNPPVSYGTAACSEYLNVEALNRPFSSVSMLVISGT